MIRERLSLRRNFIKSVICFRVILASLCLHATKMKRTKRIKRRRKGRSIT
jgi:hypothetical protein